MGAVETSVMEKNTGTLATGLPDPSKTLAVINAERGLVIRAGLAVTMSLTGSVLPIFTWTVPLFGSAFAVAIPRDSRPVNRGVVVVVVVGAPVGEADGPGAAPPPENPVTVAVPDRLSDTRLTRAMPSFVFASPSTRPRSVTKKMTVPFGTGVPAASITTAVITDTPPLAGMEGGLAVREM